MDYTESNRLIANYMGYSKTGNTYNIPGIHPYLHHGLLKFHKSWDWMMWVIDKISKEPTVMITSHFADGLTWCQITILGGMMIGSSGNNDKLLCFYEAAIGYIKHQNEMELNKSRVS